MWPILLPKGTICISFSSRALKSTSLPRTFSECQRNKPETNTRISNHTSHLDEKSLCSLSSPKRRMPNANPRMATGTTRVQGIQVSLAAGFRVIVRSLGAVHLNWWLVLSVAQDIAGVSGSTQLWGSPLLTWLRGSVPPGHLGALSSTMGHHTFSSKLILCRPWPHFFARAKSTLAVALRPLSRLPSLKLNVFSSHGKKGCFFSRQPEASGKYSHRPTMIWNKNNTL